MFWGGPDRIESEQKCPVKLSNGGRGGEIGGGEEGLWDPGPDRGSDETIPGRFWIRPRSRRVHEGDRGVAEERILVLLEEGVRRLQHRCEREGDVV